MKTCSLGDDGVPSYKDSCSFTCNTGYKLSGSDTRTCQSDGRWNGSETMCSRGEYVECACLCMHVFVYMHVCVCVCVHALSNLPWVERFDSSDSQYLSSAQW